MSKCPTCGCRVFYVKDSDDEYEIHEFTVNGGVLTFDPRTETRPVIVQDARVYCNKCSWRGCLREIVGG